MNRSNVIQKVAQNSALEFLAKQSLKFTSDPLQHDGNRLVFLGIQTTGLSIEDGDRIIEIAAIEYINNQPDEYFHCYLNPGKEIDPGVQKVHGLSLEFLKNKPIFLNIADELLQFLAGAKIVAHNTRYILGFVENEFNLVEKPSVAEKCMGIEDTLKLADKIRSKKHKSLDALFNYYSINDSMGTLNATLLDVALMAQIYIALISETELGNV